MLPWKKKKSLFKWCLNARFLTFKRNFEVLKRIVKRNGSKQIFLTHLKHA